MEFKFLILSPKNYDIKTLLHTIESENDNLVISNKFINDIKYKDTEKFKEGGEPYNENKKR
jgi:hypothetical protein